MKVLITGSSGFTGRYIIDHIQKEVKKTNLDIDIAGLHRSNDFSLENSINQICADICDYSDISDAICRFKPDYIIHLAGGRNGNLDDLFQVNVSGTVNLLEAVRNHCDPSARILYVSSSAVYGYAGDESLSEDTPLRPVGDYGITKATGEMAAISYSIKYGMNISVVRPFNLLGPGQDDSFVTGRIISRTHEIMRGDRDSLSLYSVYSCRDFVDVRDAVSAYWCIISSSEFENLCRSQVFNVGSGKSNSIRQILSLLEEITGREIIVNLPDFIEPEKVPNQVSNNKKIRETLGWKPNYTLKKTLSDMLEYYVKKE